MAFLTALAAKVLEYFIEKIGKYIAKTISEFIAREKQKKIDEENTKKHVDDIKNNVTPEQKGRGGADLINGSTNRVRNK